MREVDSGCKTIVVITARIAVNYPVSYNFAFLKRLKASLISTLLVYNIIIFTYTLAQVLVIQYIRSFFCFKIHIN